MKQSSAATARPSTPSSRRCGAAFVELSTVSTVHCEIARKVKSSTARLHNLATTVPPGIEFYSGAWGCPYPVGRQKAADAITAQAAPDR